jgi:glycosyltransferase involved in cell wall biosynthesis
LSRPRFSIVVPTFNQGQFLEVCLRSLITQREQGSDLEILVLDGGSTDQTTEILKSYDDDLAYWRSAPDEGQASALDEGFGRARGQIFGWLNSDDALLPGALPIVSDWFDSHPGVPTVYGDAVWVDTSGAVIRAKREIPFRWNLFAYGYCYLPQPSTFFTADAYRGVGGLDTSLQCTFDYDLWHRLAASGPVGHIDQVLSLIRDHPATKTNMQKETFAVEGRLLQRRYLPRSLLPYGITHYTARCLRVGLKLASGRYRRLTRDEHESVLSALEFEKS